MKKFMITLLITIITTINVQSVNAYSEDLQKISFSDIKSFMIENSLEMKTNENTLNNTKQELTKINDSIDDLGYSASNISDEIDDLEDEIDDLEDKLSGLDKTSEDYEQNKTQVNNSITSKNQTLQELKSLKSKRITAQHNLKKARLNYESQVEDAVYKCQQSYIEYLKILSDLENKQNSIELQNKKTDISKLKYQYGFISKNELENSYISSTDVVKELDDLKDKQEIALKNLKQSLGVEQDEEFMIEKDIEKDLEDVSEINYEDDLEEMLENSTELTVLNLEIEWEEDEEDEEDDDDDDDDYDYENYNLENEKLSLESKYITLQINFKEKYNNLMEAYNSLKISYDKYSKKEEDLENTNKKYSYGFISQNELEEARIALYEEKSTLESEENQFYLKYLDYTQMREGY